MYLDALLVSQMPAHGFLQLLSSFLQLLLQPCTLLLRCTSCLARCFPLGLYNMS